MVGFALWWYLGTLDRYGVDGSGGWWDPGLNTAALVFVAVVVIVPGVPLAWTEAWAVQQRSRWGARLLATVFALMAGFAAHLFAGLRFFGDTSPTDLSDLTFAWVTYPAMVGLQLLLVWWMARWPFPTTKRGTGRRLAKRLGLVE
jgi:hypothetical protein